MSKIKKKFLSLVLMALIVIPSVAQTISPYSRYGYGVLRDQVSGPSKGMGGIGYGLKTKLGANPMNPASYSAVDSLTFLFDIGVDWRSVKLSDNSGKQSENDGGLEYITMLFPVTKKLGVSFGLLPYSSVGYRYGTRETEKGEIYSLSYEGSGGLSQIYAGVGYETPLKGLSVGVNVSYLYGKLKHDKSLRFENTAINPSYENIKLSVSTMKLDIGAQYELNLSERNRLVLGALYSPRNNHKGSYERIRYEYNGRILSSDTTSVSDADAGFPDTYGLGFTFVRDNRLTLGADATYQRWSDVKYTSLMNDDMNSSQRFNDRWKFGIGGEYRHGIYERNYLKRIRYRVGFNYSNSYLNYQNSAGRTKGYNEYGVTLGLGLPFIESFYRTGRVSYINLNFEYKKIDPEVKGMIKEEYYGVSVNVNINELWFRKRKIN